MEPSNHESGWDRTKKTVRPAWGSAAFSVGSALFVTIAAASAFLIAGDRSRADQAAIAVLVGACGLVFALLSVLAAHAWMAPRRQRDEARERATGLALELEQLRSRSQAELLTAHQDAELARMRLDSPEAAQAKAEARRRTSELRGILTRIEDDLSYVRAFAEAGVRLGDDWKGQGWGGLATARYGATDDGYLRPLATYEGLQPLWVAIRSVYLRLSAFGARSDFETGVWRRTILESYDSLPQFFAALLDDVAKAERLLGTAREDVRGLDVASPSKDG